MLENPLEFEENIGYLIGRLSKTMIRMLEENFQLAGYEGLTIEHWFVLKHLWERDGRTQAELGKLAGKGKVGVSRAVDWLEKENFVLRITDQNDRRNKRIHLTHAGKELKPILVQSAKSTLKKVIGDIPQESIDSCKIILREMLKNVS